MIVNFIAYKEKKIPKRPKAFNILESFRKGMEVLNFEEVRELIIAELVSKYEYTLPQAREAFDIFLNRDKISY